MTQASNGLQGFIEEAIVRKLCVQIHCTTCGAHEFREALWKRVSGTSTGNFGPMLGNARALAQLMACLQRKSGYTYEYERAVRLMLFEIWPFLGKEDGESELERILRRTWAGQVLADMKAHWVARREAQRVHEEHEANAPKRREEKKRLKAEQHAARLAAKVQRNRLWREKQKGGKG